MQEKALGLQVSDPAFGTNSLESLAKWDPVSLSWKTSQLCLLGGLETFSGPWPRSGTMRNGESFAHPMLALHTEESGSLLWPTPDASMSIGGPNTHARKTKQGRFRASQHAPKTVVHGVKNGQRIFEPVDPGKYINPLWVESLMGFPIGWTDGPLDPEKPNTNGSRRARLIRRPTEPLASKPLVTRWCRRSQ